MLTAAPAAGLAVGSQHLAFRQVRHFGSLDGLRAFSVVAVIWHHVVGHDPSLPHWLNMGAHGVTLFFAISGFLITTLLLREHDRAGKIDLRAFYVRRALRIFPLYYTVLAIYVALVFLVEKNSPAGREFRANIIYFLTYTSNWFVLLEGRTIFYFAWSLAAEEQFYLLWPSVQRFFSLRKSFFIMLSFIAVVILLQWFVISPDTSKAWWQRAIVEFPLAICFGVILALVFHRQAGFDSMRWIFFGPYSSAVWAGVFLFTLQMGRTTVEIHLAAALLVGSCVYRENHILAPLLRWRPLAFVGAVSYGVYLLHMLVKNAVVRVLGAGGVVAPKYLVFVLTVAATLAVAWLSFRYFEAIFLRKKERFAVAA